RGFVLVCEAERIRAQRGAEVEQARREERSGPFSEALHEGRRHAERNGGQHGSPTAAPERERSVRAGRGHDSESRLCRSERPCPSRRAPGSRVTSGSGSWWRFGFSRRSNLLRFNHSTSHRLDGNLPRLHRAWQSSVLVCLASLANCGGKAVETEYFGTREAA